MTLSERLREYIAAAFMGIWIQSHEHADALAEIAQLCRDQNWALATWDVERGLSVAAQANASASDPVAAIRSINALAQPNSSAVLVMVNLHRFLGSIEVVQALAHQLVLGRQNRTFIIVLAPLVQIPPELERMFAIVEHELPDRDQLLAIAQGVATEPGELSQDGELQKVLDAACGLTRIEAENAMALSLVRQGKLTPQTLWEIKASTLKASGLLSLHKGSESFADLGGLDSMKHFCLRALNSTCSSRARARGILLLGVPGTGKSCFAKALGQETSRPTLVLDLGSLMGSLVGESERNMRQALRITEAMAPCVLMVDELEKGLAGAVSGSVGDSGVSARLFGFLLSWLADHESEVFVIATCNDVSRLPPELSRAERFDGIFFLDLPSSQEKAGIWQMYQEHYDLSDQKLPASPDWTGAEIKSCCRLAALLDLPLSEAARNIVPVAVTASESVQKLRSWASGRCLDASQGGIYCCRTDGNALSSSGRKVSRGSGMAS